MHPHYLKVTHLDREDTAKSRRDTRPDSEHPLSCPHGHTEGCPSPPTAEATDPGGARTCFRSLGWDAAEPGCFQTAIV